jgi:hypothetical protein
VSASDAAGEIFQRKEKSPLGFPVKRVIGISLFLPSRIVSHMASDEMSAEVEP